MTMLFVSAIALGGIWNPSVGIGLGYAGIILMDLSNIFNIGAQPLIALGFFCAAVIYWLNT